VEKTKPHTMKMAYLSTLPFPQTTQVLVTNITLDSDIKGTAGIRKKMNILFHIVIKANTYGQKLQLQRNTSLDAMFVRHNLLSGGSELHQEQQGKAFRRFCLEVRE
jgi:hypothetical protein